MKKLTAHARPLLALALALLLLFPLVGPAANAAEPGETRMFDTEEEALAWKALVEQEYLARNDGFDYTLTWTGPTRIVTGTEERTVLTTSGDAVNTTFGPYATEEEARAALEAEQAADPSTPLRQVTFSGITAVQTAEGGQRMEFSSDEYATAAERDAALEVMLAHLESQGWILDENSIEMPRRIIDVTVETLTKVNEQNASYVIPAGGYIVVKQADWFFIWTAEDLSAFTDDLYADVIAHDRSLAAVTFKGLFSGYDVDFTFPEETASGVYRVTDHGDGTCTLTVSDLDGTPNGKRISHMDYGVWSADARYAFRLTYTIPVTVYTFTKTVQAYEERVEVIEYVQYEISYTVTATPKETAPAVTEPEVEEPSASAPRETEPSGTDAPDDEDRTDANIPKTGDPISLWMSLSLLSAAAILAVTGKNRRLDG